MEEIVILQTDELRILAGAMKIERICGLGESKALDERDVLYTIHEMTEKGIFRMVDEKLEMCSPYREIMSTLAAPQVVWSCHRYTGGNPDTVIYVGEKLVTIEESFRDADALRVGIYEPETLYMLLDEKEYLPKPGANADLTAFQSEQEVVSRLPEGMWADIASAPAPVVGDGLEDMPLYEQFLKYPGGAEEASVSVVLINNPFNYRIALNVGGETELLCYDKETMFRILNGK